jgi:hypothetical protein
VWIPAAIGVLLLAVAITGAVTGHFGGRTASTAESGRKDPRPGMAALAAAEHPELETVSMDERAGTITMWGKSTGKVTVFGFDPGKHTLVAIGGDGDVAGSRINTLQRVPRADGWFVEILEDARITPELHTEAWRTGQLDGMCEIGAGTPEFCASIAKEQLRLAIVRLVGAPGSAVAFPGGAVQSTAGLVAIDARGLEVGSYLADVSVEHLYVDERPTFFVTVDKSIGMGSYTGPFTYPVELDGERLVGLRVENEGTREQYPLELRATLKSGWRIAASSDGGKELLAVSCYPNAASLEKGVHPTERGV